MAGRGQASPSEGQRVAGGEAAWPVAVVENALGSSPLLLICEHASNHIPARYGDLGLSAADREAHIAWDPGALGVARGLSRVLDAPLVHASVSRLVLDLNRDPTAIDSIPAVSERTPVPGNGNVSPDERARRVAEIYRPFHDTVDAVIAARSVAGLTRAVVSIHSFTPVYRDVQRPWEVGLIFDRDERLARAVAAGLRRDPSLTVGMNQPYSPADRVFHTLERHAESRRLAPLMVEIRNDLIRTADLQQTWSERLAPLLAEAVERL
jgi:predicted N-formylglutamate amidohydrolase